MLLFAIVSPLFPLTMIPSELKLEEGRPVVLS